MIKTINKLFTSKEFQKNILNTFFYFGNSIFQALIGIITAPIFARHLLPEDFAIIGYFTAIVGFCNPVIHLSMGNFYSIKYFRQSDKENKELLWSTLVFLLGWNLIILPAIYFILFFAFQIMGHSYPASPFLIIVFTSAFFNLSLLFTQINLRIRKKAVLYFLISSLMTVLNIFISLMLVVQFKMGATGRLGGKMVASIIIGMLAISFIRKQIKLRFRWSLIKEGLRLVSPLILGTLIVFTIRNIDKILLERLGNSYEFGYYNIGFNNANYLILLGNSLYAAFEPDIIKYVVNKNKQKLILYFTGITGILVSLTLVYILFSEQITNYLTSGRYTRAYKYANIIAVSGIFYSISKLLLTILMAMKKTKRILMINTLSAILALIIYAVSIRYFSFYGAAYGRVLIGFIICAITTLFIIYRNGKFVIFKSS